MRNVMKEYFLDLDRAAKDPARKVAWCTSVGPAEILRAMGFEVFFPENHGAMLGASRVCMETIPIANANGYSPEICSYLTSDIGAYMKGITPLTKAFGIEEVPRPDVLVYNTNQCKDVMHWFEYYASEFNAPIFGIHPPTNLPEIKQEYIDDVARQFEALIHFLEPIIGGPMNKEKLKSTVALSLEATNLWSDVLNMAQAAPSPMTFFDSTIYMGPIVVLRGTEIAVKYYKNLLNDLKEKIQKNHSAIPKENKRIYWDGMPVWGRLRDQSNIFKENNACVVASTYCNSWIFYDFDPENPLPSMAKAYIKIFINRNDQYKEDYIERMVKDFKIDGVIFMAARTCPNNSNAYYNLPRKLKNKGIPTIIIDGDLCDLRCYSDEQSTTLIEAFLETI
ncbi:Similar to benzoyl-CoA reductase subunit B [hydrothermal vent metagenome]|uniref:Similar to benzoyl-CoA reductase subunit B n=1 Tax=hydrothermal vent metagenome TaxID=652676 RepID=A0A3B1ALG9_9ZZZZ